MGTQSVAERRSAEDELAQLIQKLAPSQTKLFAAARRWVRKKLPTAHEIVYEYRDCVVVSFSPSGRGNEGVLGLRASDEGVRLFLNNAKSVDDPLKLLKGSGSMARWVGIENAATLKDAAIGKLVAQAIEVNPVAFEDAGRGSLVVRPTTASKRSKGQGTRRKTKAKKK